MANTELVKTAEVQHYIRKNSDVGNVAVCEHILVSCLLYYKKENCGGEYKDELK